MPVSGVGNYADIATAEKERNRTQLDQLGFIKLLVTQLSTQDPTSPMDAKDMAQQLTQLSTVQGIEDMRNSMMQVQASNMIGKQIEGVDINGTQVTGIATSYIQDSENLYLKVGTSLIPMDRVLMVSLPTASG